MSSNKGNKMIVEELTARVTFLEKQMELLMKSKSSDEEVETKGKKGKKSKDKEEKPKKKRAASGYNLFCKANRDDAKEAYIQDNEMEEGEKPTNQQVMSTLGKMWSALSEEKKAEWQDKAKKLADDVEVDDEVEVE